MDAQKTEGKRVVTMMEAMIEKSIRRGEIEEANLLSLVLKGMKDVTETAVKRPAIREALIKRIKEKADPSRYAVDIAVYQVQEILDLIAIASCTHEEATELLGPLVYECALRLASPTVLKMLERFMC